MTNQIMVKATLIFYILSEILHFIHNINAYLLSVSKFLHLHACSESFEKNVSVFK